MARSKQNSSERRFVPEMESAPHDRADIVRPQDRSCGRSAPAQETLNIGHAGVRSECWAALTPRSRRPERKRLPLRCTRPSHVAEARFTSEDYDLLP